jgi:tetratricopeptide (TPR) repeat protein
MKPYRRLALLLLPAAVGATFISHARQESDPILEQRRVLVAPAPVRADREPDPLAVAMPALIAEAVSADGVHLASLVHDLSPGTLRALGVEAGGLPGAELMASDAARQALLEEGSVRMLLLPSMKRKGSAKRARGHKLTLRWEDLVSGEGGVVSEASKGVEGSIDAAGRAARAAREAWSRSWAPSDGPSSGANGKVSRLSRLTSSSPEALTAWARATEAWNRGDVPAAEKGYLAALDDDSAFDRAKLDLAWLRLGQGRVDDAARLAEEARAGGRISWAARGLAEIISAASGERFADLEERSGAVETELRGTPLEMLAFSLARNLTGEHERAMTPLHDVRIHRPNDPFLLHQAGMAALGSLDEYESLLHLERAAALWPKHDRIQMDLAEAKVRARDLPGAQKVLDEWRLAHKPTDPPVWGGAWSIEDPPPSVRAVGVGLLNGSIERSIEKLDKEVSILQITDAPSALRVAVLHALHEMQMQLAIGAALPKQRWLNGARGSLRALREIMPAEEQEARPWVLDRLEAILRVREDRLDEARRIRERILEASNLPGYDPAVEAEVEAVITLKDADNDAHFEACNRAVAVRGSLNDYFRLGQAYAISRRWDEAEELYLVMEERRRSWSAARRRDAVLWSPLNSVETPFIHLLGGLARVWRGQPELAKERFGIFLGYFRHPDGIYVRFKAEAESRGGVPAW